MKLTQNIALFTAVAMGSIQTASASFGIGAGIGVSSGIYRNYDTKVLPMPIINYDSDTFYFRGLGGGYHLFKDRHNQLSLNAYYLPLEFKPSRANNLAMKRLDKRKSTAMGGLIYRHVDSWGIIRTSLAADLLDNNKGVLGDIAYLYPFTFSRTTITAGIGSVWASKNYNKHYFGISGKESARSGLSYYKPDDSWSPYAEINFHNNINANWSINVSGRLTKLTSEVKDSPMVDTNYNYAAFIGINYQF